MDSLFNRSGKLPMIVIIIVAVVVVGGAGAFAFVKMHKKSGKVKKHVEYVNWKFENKIMTLADSDELHYLKASLTLEMEYKDKSKMPSEGAEDPETAKALDVINTVCSGKTLSDLLAKEGKDKLKDEIIEKLNQKLENSQVHDVYLTDFALQ